MNISRLRLVTFDVTDTLLKLRRDPGELYSKIGARYGINCDSKILKKNFKTNFMKMKKDHPNFGVNSGLGWENWWKNVVIGTFKDSSVDLNNDKFNLIASHLIHFFETENCWQQNYGTLGLLCYFRNKGLPLGIISNYDPRLNNILINTKLRHYFNFVLASYEFKIEKPSSEIFKKALEISQINNLKPYECLHVGNTPDLDYFGAIQSGWQAVLIHEGNTKEYLKKYPYVHACHLFTNLYNFHKHLIKTKEIKVLKTL